MGVRAVGWYPVAGQPTSEVFWDGDSWSDSRQSATEHVADASAASVRSPGWYEHPTMVQTLGYWDGNAWSGDVAPAGGHQRAHTGGKEPSAGTSFGTDSAFNAARRVEPAPPTARPSNKRGSRWASVLVVALLVLVGTAGAIYVAVHGAGSHAQPKSGAGSKSSPLVGAAAACKVTMMQKPPRQGPPPDPDRYIALGTDSKSVVMAAPNITARAKVAYALSDWDPSTVSLDNTTCIVSKLGGPSGLRARMGATTALSGQQEETWDDFQLSWSYSAGSDGSGFQAVVQQK